jgi:pimeloyl-ACP methyl ester carboxylesterase
MHKQECRDGWLAVMGTEEALRSSRPLVVMLHGALRHSGVLAGWVAQLEPRFGVLLVDLPGHGRSPPCGTASVRSFAENIGDALEPFIRNRPTLVVGESLGGLIALALGGINPPSVKGVIAADPPLTTAKLWHVVDALKSAKAAYPDNRFIQEFARNIFGVGDGGEAIERNYYPILGDLRIPGLVMTGDLPLFPRRAVNGTPCLLDDVDRWVIETVFSDKVTLTQVPGSGHLLLTDAQHACLQLIGQFYDSLMKPAVQ